MKEKGNEYRGKRHKQRSLAFYPCNVAWLWWVLPSEGCPMFTGSFHRQNWSQWCYNMGFFGPHHTAHEFMIFSSINRFVTVDRGRKHELMSRVVGAENSHVDQFTQAWWCLPRGVRPRVYIQSLASARCWVLFIECAIAWILDNLTRWVNERKSMLLDS